MSSSHLNLGLPTFHFPRTLPLRSFLTVFPSSILITCPTQDIIFLLISTRPIIFGFPYHGRLVRWCKWRACDVGEAKEEFENELWRRWSDGRVGEWALVILQPFRHFTYVPAHSPTLPLPYLRHSSFSNPSVASPTSQLILQPFFCFSYITGSSLTSPGELPQSSFSNLSVTLSTSQLILQPFRRFTYVTAHSPTLPLLHLRHSSFSNPSFAYPTSQALHLRHQEVPGSIPDYNLKKILEV